MRILHYTGNGRTSTLKSIVAAMRAARAGGLRVQLGPFDEVLLSAYGLFVRGSDEDMERFPALMEREAKRLKIEVAPAVFVGEIE